MDNLSMNRTQLEALSFSDLVLLADKYGLEVPEDLDRRFLIAELLEVMEELKNSSPDDIVVFQESVDDKDELVRNYNETQVSAILRNPAWAFVFWNIGDSDRSMLKSQGCSLSLRICSFENPNDEKPVSAFEIQNLSSSQEQYVLLPRDNYYIKIELVYINLSSGNVLASTPIIKVPEGASFLNDMKPGQTLNCSEIIKLSGIDELLFEQYMNHRQSFA